MKKGGSEELRSAYVTSLPHLEVVNWHFAGAGLHGAERLPLVQRALGRLARESREGASPAEQLGVSGDKQ